MSQGNFNCLIAKSFRVGLDYEFWPALSAEATRKTLVVLHGRGDRGEGFHWLPEALNIESFNYLFLDAPDSYGGGFSWYGVPPGQGPGVLRSRQLLWRLLEQLQTECGLRPGDIFLFGFSQGCLMSLDVGLRFPQPLGGIVGSSGYLFFGEEYPSSFSPILSSQRMLVTHGTQDDMLPIEKTRASIKRLQQLGAPIDWREYEKTHTVDPVEEIPDIRAFYMRLLEAS